MLTEFLRLLCVLSDGSIQDAACNVRVVGRLEGYNGFTLEVKKTTHSIALMTDLSQHTKPPRSFLPAFYLNFLLLGTYRHLERGRR